MDINLVDNIVGNTTENTGKIKGGCTGKGFDVSGQPSPESKKKGWQRRKEAQKIMDLILDISDLSMDKIKELLKDIESNPSKHTLLEAKLVRYVMKDKFTIDFLDRHISKAPQDINLDNSGNIKIITEFVDEPTEDEVSQVSEGSPV